LVEIDYYVDCTLDICRSVLFECSSLGTDFCESSTELNVTVSSHASHERTGCFNRNVSGSCLENTVLVLSSCLKEKSFSDILLQFNATRWMLEALYFHILMVSNEKEYVDFIS